jgi:hypothetical protein
MDKHTPGPWHNSPKMSSSENHNGWGIYVYGKWIADVSPMNEENGDPSWEGEANIALITAAPDMYEALKLAKVALEYLTSSVPTTFDHAHSQVCAALDKAGIK